MFDRFSPRPALRRRIGRASESMGLLAMASRRGIRGRCGDARARDAAAIGTISGRLCRNVLIYFAEATVVRVTNALAGALQADGCLLTSASESLVRFGTKLRCEERGGTFFYTKEAA